MANLAQSVERKAFSVAIDAALKHLNKDREKEDSVKLDKGGFLPKRDLYTYQLKNYLEYDLKSLDYTCMIYFSENKKKLEKEAAKVKSKYKKNKTIVLMPIAPEAFRFKKPEE